MKILIVGAGIIGVTYGWALSGAGHDVVHIVHKGRSERLAKGISLDMLDKRQGRDDRTIERYMIKAIEDLDPSVHFDFTIVPVHHYDLIETLKQYAPFLGGSNFILLTQNWHGTADIDEIIPRAKYVFGDAKAGGSFVDGILVAAIRTVDIGWVGKGRNRCLDGAMELFASAELDPRSHDDILHYLWIQYALAAGMWPPLVRMGSIEEVVKVKSECRNALAGAEECIDVVRRRGANLDGYPEIKMFIDGSLRSDEAALSMLSQFNKDEYSKRSSSHALNSVREVSAFYYDLLKTGRELGAEMPVMASYEKDIEMFCKKG